METPLVIYFWKHILKCIYLFFYYETDCLLILPWVVKIMAVSMTGDNKARWNINITVTNTTAMPTTTIVVQSLSHVQLFTTPLTAVHQASLSFPILPCPLSPGVCSTSCTWVSEAIQPSHPLSPASLLPSVFPCIRVFLMNQLFPSGGQSIGASTSVSVFPVIIKSLFPLGLSGLVSLQSKGLSGVFFNTTIQNHQFFGAQPSLWSNSHICIW